MKITQNRTKSSDFPLGVTGDRSANQAANDVLRIVNIALVHPFVNVSLQAQWEVARFSSVLCNFYSLSWMKSVIDYLFGINTCVFLYIRFSSTTSETIGRKSRKYNLIAVMILVNKLSNYTVIYGLIVILINIDYHLIPPIESIPQFLSICQRTRRRKE